MTFPGEDNALDAPKTADDRLFSMRNKFEPKRHKVAPVPNRVPGKSFR